MLAEVVQCCTFHRLVNNLTDSTANFRTGSFAVSRYENGTRRLYVAKVPVTLSHARLL